MLVAHRYKQVLAGVVLPPDELDALCALDCLLRTLEARGAKRLILRTKRWIGLVRLPPRLLVLVSLSLLGCLNYLVHDERLLGRRHSEVDRILHKEGRHLL